MKLRVPAILALALCLSSCDSETSPEFLTPLMIAGTIDAVLDSNPNRPQGFIYIRGRTDTPTESFEAITDFGIDGAFAVAVPEGEFQIRIEFPGSPYLYFVDLTGTPQLEEVWVSTTVDEPLAELHIPFGSVTVTIDESRGAPWEVALYDENRRRVEWIDDFTPENPAEFKRLPLGKLKLELESVHREDVIAQVRAKGKMVDSLSVEASRTHTYEVSTPEPAIVRCRLKGVSLDWELTDAEFLVFAQRFFGYRTFYRGPVYDGLEIAVSIFEPEPLFAEINLGFGQLRMPFGLPRDFYYPTSLEKETVIEAEFGGIELVVLSDTLAVDDFDFNIYAEQNPGYVEHLGPRSSPTDAQTSTIVPLPTGRWHIEIEPDSDIHLPDQWLDGAVNLLANRPIEIATGSVQRIEWTPWPGGRIRGQLDRGPSELEKLFLVEADEDIQFTEVPLAKDGTFDISGLEHGFYRLAYARAGAIPELQYYPDGVDFAEATVFSFEEILFYDDLFFDLRDGLLQAGEATAGGER